VNEGYREEEKTFENKIWQNICGPVFDMNVGRYEEDTIEKCRKL